MTQPERTRLQSLALSSLGAPPPDPSNVVADSKDAASLGRALFSDTRLSVNGEVSCATCHQPERDFTDGKALSEGVGRTNRKSMSVVSAAHSRWQFWDGRKDSLWSQALEPLEAPAEHGLTRTEVAALVGKIYRDDYEAVFGPLPDFGTLPNRAGPNGDEAAKAAWDDLSAAEQEAVTRVFVNTGKALAAFERGLEPAASRFDRYAEAALRSDPTANTIFTADERAGYTLFTGKAGCAGCHNGPLFSDGSFHNTGVPQAAGLEADTGRAGGVSLAQNDEFNCLSRYSDAPAEACTALKELETESFGLERAFKVPSLRNVAGRAPYMHAGQFGTLREVLEHYNRAPEAPAGFTELRPLGLSDGELGQLEAFLNTLSSEKVQ